MSTLTDDTWPADKLTLYRGGLLAGSPAACRGGGCKHTPPGSAAHAISAHIACAHYRRWRSVHIGALSRSLSHTFYLPLSYFISLSLSLSHSLSLSLSLSGVWLYLPLAKPHRQGANALAGLQRPGVSSHAAPPCTTLLRRGVPSYRGTMALAYASRPFD